MSEFLLQPDVYRTGARKNLLGMLEDTWINDRQLGDGDLYILSGFGNYNGGVRFYSTFREHVDLGGRAIAFFGGSRSQRLTSRQLVSRMLDCGCEVRVINRKRIFHTKCYGWETSDAQNLVITSGNFTGPGLSQNVEAALSLDDSHIRQVGFNWADLRDSILSQNWDVYEPRLDDLEGPAWDLLYDEKGRRPPEEELDLVTMIVSLGHADTARINADRGTNAGKGSQYFWLSKDCFDFFPALTILNERGYKTTNSCIITLNYIDIGVTDTQCRVTFEAGNNVDFRLGTGKLKYTKTASINDLAAISRVGDEEYDLRILRDGSPEHQAMLPYATTHIGNRGKRFGFLSNERFNDELQAASGTAK